MSSIMYRNEEARQSQASRSLEVCQAKPTSPMPTSVCPSRCSVSHDDALCLRLKRVWH